MLGRKGCSKTALEYCKLLLGLNPKQDTHGVLLRIDYYAIRAKDYGFLLNFIDQFADQIHSKVPSDKISCVILMPNLMMTKSLALRATVEEEESKNHNEELSREIAQINKHVEGGNVPELFKRKSGDLWVMLCLILYPQCLKALLEKVAKKQIS